MNWFFFWFFKPKNNNKTHTQIHQRLRNTKKPEENLLLLLAIHVIVARCWCYCSRFVVHWLTGCSWMNDLLLLLLLDWIGLGAHILNNNHYPTHQKSIQQDKFHTHAIAWLSLLFSMMRMMMMTKLFSYLLFGWLWVVVVCSGYGWYGDVVYYYLLQYIYYATFIFFFSLFNKDPYSSKWQWWWWLL